jgi:integrase
LREGAGGASLRYTLAVTSGMRDGEIAGLTWADIDLSSALPIVRVTKQISTRRDRAADLIEYKQKDEAYRKAVFDELTAEADKHGLGY